MPRRIRAKRLLSGCAIALLVLLTMGASDQGKRYERLGHEMVCICGCNQILLECNHVGCTASAKMLDQLGGKLKAGSNDDSILKDFVTEYGPTVLAAPTKRGFDLLAWIMPFAVFFMGIGLVMMIVRNWKLATAPAAVNAPRHLSPQHADLLRSRARQETEL